MLETHWYSLRDFFSLFSHVIGFVFIFKFCFCLWFSNHRFIYHFCHEWHLKRSGMTQVNEGSPSFICYPRVYPHVEWAIPAFTFWPQSFTALWLVIIFHLLCRLGGWVGVDRRLSHGRLSSVSCLVHYRYFVLVIYSIWFVLHSVYHSVVGVRIRTSLVAFLSCCMQCWYFVICIFSVVVITM